MDPLQVSYALMYGRPRYAGDYRFPPHQRRDVHAIANMLPVNANQEYQRFQIQFCASGCREGGPEADAEVEAGEVNILALLSPFMTRQFPSRQGTPLAAPHAQSAAPASAVPATPSGQERAAEERAVRAYIAASGEAPSAMAAGATLLCAVVQQKGQPWPRDLAKQTLSLAAVLRPSWKAKGEMPLMLPQYKGMHVGPRLIMLCFNNIIVPSPASHS